MSKWFDYFLIVAVAFLQAGFLPINLLIALLIYWLFRHDLEYFLPRAFFASFCLGLLSSSSIGGILFVFSLLGLAAYLIKTLLPRALFIRVSTIVLAVAAVELLYRSFSLLWIGR